MNNFEVFKASIFLGNIQKLKEKQVVTYISFDFFLYIFKSWYFNLCIEGVKISKILAGVSTMNYLYGKLRIYQMCSLLLSTVDLGQPACVNLSTQTSHTILIPKSTIRPKSP